MNTHRPKTSWRRAIGAPLLGAVLASALAASTAQAQNTIHFGANNTAASLGGLGAGQTFYPEDMAGYAGQATLDLVEVSFWSGNLGGAGSATTYLAIYDGDPDTSTLVGMSTNFEDTATVGSYVKLTWTFTSVTLNASTEYWAVISSASPDVNPTNEIGKSLQLFDNLASPNDAYRGSSLIAGRVPHGGSKDLRFIVTFSSGPPVTPIADWDFTNAANPAHGTGGSIPIGLGVSVLANAEVTLETGLACSDMIVESIWSGDPCGPLGPEWSAGNSVPTGELNIQKWDGDGPSGTCGADNDGVNDNYIAFTLDASPGTVDIDEIVIDVWRNGGGAPSLYGVDVVVDGGAAVQFGSRHEEASTGAPSDVINFTDTITGATTVEIRFVPADGSTSSAGTGNLHIDGLSVYGAVVAVPPCADDSYEDNDDCATAAAASVGLTTGLVVAGDLSGGGVDDDWFSFDVADGEEILVSTYFIDANGDMDLELYDVTGGCPGAQVDSSAGVSDVESVSWLNTTGATATVAIYNFLYAGSGNCQDYDMEITITAPPTCVDDAFEDNDDCATALPGTIGTTTGLVVQGDLGSTGARDDDFWTYDVADGEYVNIDVLFIDADGDIDIRLEDVTGGVCPGTFLDSGGSVSDNESVSWQNTTGAVATVVLRVFLFSANTDCQTYDIVAVTSPCGGDDFLEENDTCDTAVTLSGTSYTDLVVYGDLGPTGAFDDDWYKVTVADGNQLNVDITFLNIDGDIDLALVDLTNGDCTPTGQIVLAYPGTITDNESVSFNNVSGADIEVGIKVWLYYAATTDCASYDMTVAQLGGPCLLPDDVYEDNEDCPTAAPLAPGVYPGLWVSSLDVDNYSFTVPAGMYVDAMVSWAAGGSEDLDLWLWEASNAGCGLPTGSGYLARAYTSSNPESFSWLNATGADVDVVLLVDEWGSGLDCVVYDLEFSLSYPSLGNVMCVGDGTMAPCPCGNDSVLGAGEGCVNSTGVGAVTAATGTPSVVDDNLVFTLSQATAAEMAVLVQGNMFSAFFVYPFRDGIYCMHNPTERMEFITTDASGNGVSTVSIVTVGGVLPGSTTYYQWYYRDVSLSAPCGGGGNFASGLEVIWLP